MPAVRAGCPPGGHTFGSDIDSSMPGQVEDSSSSSSSSTCTQQSPTGPVAKAIPLILRICQDSVRNMFIFGRILWDIIIRDISNLEILEICGGQDWTQEVPWVILQILVPFLRET